MTANEEGTDEKRGQTLIRVVAGLVVAVGITVAIAAFFSTEVCDEQIAGASTTVTVCRHLQVSDPPVIAVGLVMLASLGAFFTEISGLGFSLKHDVADAKAAVQSAKEAADFARTASASAEEVADLANKLAQDAEETARSAEREALLAEETARAAEREALLAEELSLVVSAGIERDIATLAKEYNAKLGKMNPGPKRASQMTRIVAEMITLLSGVDTDASDYLESKDRGLQLAGFAYLYANPDPGRSQELVLALTQEDQEPFSQYWGLRSLRKQLAVDPSSLDFNSRRELESLQERLDPRSDRGYELREALREAEAKTPS